MNTILIIAQIIVSAILVVIILLQSEGTGLGTIFGGSGSFYRSKRGVEKLFLYFTVFLIVLFLVLSIVQVITLNK